MTMEQFLDILVSYHLTLPDSGRHLLQELEQDSFARRTIAPREGIKKSSFFEALHSRGLDFLVQVYHALSIRAASVLPKEHADRGDLFAIDGALIDATLSATWADYRTGSNKAKAHFGFDVIRSIPSSFTLITGKGDERKEVVHLIAPGQTAITDRYYQYHAYFDHWQSPGIHFVCRIRENTTKTVLSQNPLVPGSMVFHDAIVLLGASEATVTRRPLRLVGYRANTKTFWVATERFDLTAEQIAEIYLLRWNIETFFGWWKGLLNLYHRLARSAYGMVVQLLAGLITYILLAIYCHDEFNEPVSVKRVRQLRNAIRSESRHPDFDPFLDLLAKPISKYHSYAKT